MASLTGFFRERIIETLDPIADMDLAGKKIGELASLEPAQKAAVQIRDAVIAADDAAVDKLVDSAVAGLIGMICGADPSAAHRVGNPLTQIALASSTTGYAMVLKALISTYAELERPISGEALAGVMRAADLVADQQQTIVRQDWDDARGM